jgi:hypothetical protein
VSGVIFEQVHILPPKLNIMTRIVILYSLLISLCLACTSAQINQTLGGINDALGSGELTTSQVAAGLKEALVKGARQGADDASQVDGYFGNSLIKIPFPPEVKKVADRLRQLGLGGEVDKFVLTLNRGAEQAAKEAAPIFVNAITSMTIQDAWNILKGDDNAATEYLRRTTSQDLLAKFSPIMQKALDQVNATKYYGDIISTYNKIPMVEDVNPDLNEYATQKAVDGLFLLIAQEEEKIRENPAERTTDLLRKVFAQQD